MTFGEELKNFSSKYPYQEILIDGVKVRYVLAGKKENRSIVFLNGLDMQEMWIRYVDALQETYCTLRCCCYCRNRIFFPRRISSGWLRQCPRRR